MELKTMVQELETRSENAELQINILTAKYKQLERENEENKKTITELKINNAELEAKLKGFENGEVAWQGDMDKTIKQNLELKAQIEKMKDCMTCIHNLDSQYFCTCDLGPEEQSKCCYKNNRDKWELAE